MRGHPRIPQLVEDVELARRTFKSDHLRRKRNLVVVGWAGKPHGLFVEWGKAHGIGAPVARQGERIPVVLECEFAASPNCNASADRGGVELAEIDEEGLIAARYDGCIRRDRRHLGFDPGNLRSLVEDATVAHDDQTGGGAHLVEGDSFRRQLSTDAGGIAHRERDHWLGVTRPHIHGLPLRRFASIQYGLCRRAHMRDLQNERQQQQRDPRHDQRRHERVAEKDRKRAFRH